MTLAKLHVPFQYDCFKEIEKEFYKNLDKYDRLRKNRKKYDSKFIENLFYCEPDLQHQQK